MLRIKAQTRTAAVKQRLSPTLWAVPRAQRGLKPPRGPAPPAYPHAPHQSPDKNRGGEAAPLTHLMSSAPSATRAQASPWPGPTGPSTCSASKPKKKSQPISRVLSWATIHLGSASPRTSSDLPESGADHAIGFLFGLAPSGVYLAACVTTVRGALLPHPFTLTARRCRREAVCSLLHFPWARAPQGLPGTLSCGARTFLHRGIGLVASPPPPAAIAWLARGHSTAPRCRKLHKVAASRQCPSGVDGHR